MVCREEGWQRCGGMLEKLGMLSIWWYAAKAEDGSGMMVYRKEGECSGMVACREDGDGRCMVACQEDGNDSGIAIRLESVAVVVSWRAEKAGDGSGSMVYRKNRNGRWCGGMSGRRRMGKVWLCTGKTE